MKREGRRMVSPLSLSLSLSLCSRARRLIPCLLAAALWLPTHAASQPVQGVREAQIAFSPRGEAVDSILRELRKARASVDVAMFYLSHDDLVGALCSLAQRRDVKVRVLTGDWMARPAHMPTLERLAHHGVSVFVLPMPGEARMHLKCAIIDSETVIAGAANWTPTAFDVNFEDTLIIPSRPLARRYRTHIDSLIERAEPLSKEFYEPPARTAFPDIQRYARQMRTDRFQAPRSRVVRDIRGMELYFNPGAEGARQLVQQIDQAQTRIEVGMYLLNEDTIAAALSEAAQRGVKVRALIDSGMLGGLMSQVQSLWDAGAEIHYYQEDRASMHLKTAVIDGRYVWTGSANWTTGAMTLNVEDMLMFDSMAMAGLYTEFLNGIRAFSQSFAPLSRDYEIAESDVKEERDRSGFLIGLPPTGPATNFSGLNLSLDPFFPSFDVNASVAYLPDDGYLPVLLDGIRNAHQSVLISMFVMPKTATEAEHQGRVMRELVRAAARGVYVYMLLHLPPGMEGLHEDHSNWARELREQGVDVRLSLPGVHLHDKMVVVDLAKVFIGSHNWSDGALSGERVYETSALLVLDRQEPKFAEYVFSRQTISDMRSQEHWEQEISLLRHMRAMSSNEREGFIRELDAKAQP